MTKRDGAIIGVILGVILYVFFKLVQSNPNLDEGRLLIANYVFFGTQIAFLFGFVLGFASFFRKNNKNILGSAGRDSLLLALSFTFDAISILIALVNGQALIPF